MDLSFLSDDFEPLNEHQIAWLERDWDKIKELSKQFKKPDEQALFDILNNVTQKTGYLSAAHFESYNQYAINHALSQHPSMLGYAYELNLMDGTITDEQHYDYLYHTVRQCKLPRVKFAKVSDDWEQRVFERLVARYYEVSVSRAIEYIDEFNQDQITRLKKIFKGSTSDNDPALLVVPTKVERERVFKIIRDW